MPWWMWLVIGFILVGAELFVPLDFYLVFIGVAFLLTGSIVWFDVIPSASYQFTLCAVLAVLLILSVRKRFSRAIDRGDKRSGSEISGSSVTLTSDIAGNGTGKGECRGSVWTVRNKTSDNLISGRTYIVSRVEGVYLIIEDAAAK